MGSFEKLKPLEGTKNSRSYNLHGCTAAVLYWLGVMLKNSGLETLYQGVKLRLIQAPMWLNFSLWQPNPEN